jgi:hypothetical protein
VGVCVTVNVMYEHACLYKRVDGVCSVSPARQMQELWSLSWATDSGVYVAGFRELAPLLMLQV